jgi:hypothetical protein
MLINQHKGERKCHSCESRNDEIAWFCQIIEGSLLARNTLLNLIGQGLPRKFVHLKKNMGCVPNLNLGMCP